MDSFKTPEEVAQSEQIKQLADTLDSPGAHTSHTARRNWKQALGFSQLSKKKLVFLTIVLVLSLGAGVTTILMRKSQAPIASVGLINKSNSSATTVSSVLSGLPVDPAINQKTVTGVMIENSPQARPQAGLSQASVVFEAIAEAGITRFLALFQDTAPSNVGPIRSARPYFAQWAIGFDAAYAHVGGSPKALANIKEWKVKDLDQFHNAGAYHRINNRPAPHNVYTSISKLNELENSKGFTTSKFNGFLRKKETPTKTPDARIISLAISSPQYNVRYEYNPASNSYNRNQAGAPHIDANTNKHISPKVVVALVVPYGLESDRYHSVYNIIGSGTAYLFQDGQVTTGQWHKADNASRIRFTDNNGKILKLNPGQTWLTAVSATNQVTYAP